MSRVRLVAAVVAWVLFTGALVRVVLGLVRDELTLDDIGVVVGVGLIAATATAFASPPLRPEERDSRLAQIALAVALASILFVVIPALIDPENPPSTAIYAYSVVMWGSGPLAVALGVAGWRRLSAAKDRGLAVAAIVIGLVITLLWMLFLFVFEPS